MEPSLQMNANRPNPPQLQEGQEPKVEVEVKVKDKEVRRHRNPKLTYERQVACYRALADNPQNWMTVYDVVKDPRVAVVPGELKDVHNALRRIVELNLATRKKEPGRMVAYRWNVHSRNEDIEFLVKGIKVKQEKSSEPYQAPQNSYPISDVERLLSEPMEVVINGINFELAGASKVMLERSADGKVKVRVLG